MLIGLLSALWNFSSVAMVAKFEDDLILSVKLIFVLSIEFEIGVIKCE